MNIKHNIKHYEENDSDGSGDTYDINLTSGKPWKALYCAEWLTVTPESGTSNATVTVGTDAWANEDSKNVRLACVYFTDGTDTV
ncbi:MAG TPA: BACON domain-containing protein [Candidatus Coprenecus merdigallinarum]|nr:BACON domain-containing protein [Candidatus Coprenecus merdigallinarum]